ncbi:MAG TPA: ABC-2 family transporter protein [Acidobacteriota bacterium]|nr:ABC-2 family transporter protein [Acidobacteriota bacterium]
MRGLPGIYLQQLKTGVATMLQYRATLAIWLIGNILEPLIYLVVWSTVSRSTGGSIGGYDPGDFAAYYIVLMLVNHATFTWEMYEFDFRIREGTFSAALLHPVHPIHADIAQNLSSKAVSLPFILAAAAGLAALFHPAFRPAWWTAAAFIPALVLGFLVRFLTDWTVALAAFWTTRVSAINEIHYMAVLFFSGQFAPLTVLPHFFQVVASILPFRWTIGFPVELLLGRLTPGQVWAGFGMQAAWLLAAAAILRFAWRASVKRYTAVGA